ncbi:MAG: hypothetical protein D6722_28025 [Bacteroidetes bacterium]|nr:MAG: hypothetical protein D6722_28025 [Bacteroidota bacterium]
MSETASRLRQKLWQVYRAVDHTLHLLKGDAPMVQGSLYLLRRKCGKPNCRCARGELHASWVLTRSESGRGRLYPVRAEQLATLRPLAREYRRWQQARARLVKQCAEMVALIDELAEGRLQSWPPDKPDGDPTA